MAVKQILVFKEPYEYNMTRCIQIYLNPKVICFVHIIITSQGWFSPGQVFVLDEYCARYGVRGCYRHLCYLSDLLDRAEKQHMIDPTLIHYSFAFCASHVHGNR